MAKSAVVENELGCGLMGGIFQRRILPPRKTSVVVRSIPTNTTTTTATATTTTTTTTTTTHTNSKTLPKVNSDKPLVKKEEKLPANTKKQSIPVSPRPSSFSSTPRKSTTSSSSNNSSSTATKVSLNQHNSPDLNRIRKEVSGISTDLSTIINDHQQSNSGNKGLLRATSGNIMLLGHLGNLKQQPNHKNNGNTKTGHQSINGNIGNIVKRPSCENQGSGNLYRKSTDKFDPEVLKCLGNEEYKQGRFEEALDFYNQAIKIDPSKAAYRSNKAAALAGLGRLIEAVFECKEAIRIEPHYHRAHHRLATLYLRLGEAEKALCHYKYSSPKADTDYTVQAQALQTHLKKCSQAQKLRDWSTLLKETQWGISSGVDSSPQIYALQAEALLKLHRHQEAHATFRKRPNFDINSCIEFFGIEISTYLLMTQAQLYLAMGRLEDAVASAQHATRIDSTNKEASAVLRRVHAVVSARLRGNQLFKALKFSEACAAYSEGLENDSYNSLLLCNRAACRSKLGQFEKAVEDCNAALEVRPSYSKARLRRANCNAKLERWEASIQDYETLIRETPGDEEVGRALFDAQVQLKKQQGEDTTDMKFGSNLVIVNSNERFRHFTTSPGMSVVLFCNKSCNKHVLQLLDQVCKRFPSVNFLKVEVEDHPYLVKSEGVSSIPAFKIYKNGSRVKEIPGNNCEFLENAIKVYSS